MSVQIQYQPYIISL